MSDTDEIRNLIARYAHCIDDRRADLLPTLFAEDAEWVTPIGTRRGRQAILAGAAASYEDLLERDRMTGQKSKHLVMNSVIVVDGGRATALSDFVVVKSIPDLGGVVLRGGRYEDEFVRVNGRWLFAKRVHHSGDFQSASPTTVADDADIRTDQGR